MQRKHLASATVAYGVVLINTPAAAQMLHVNPRWEECSFQIDPSLTQPAWRQFTREAGFAIYFRSISNARPLAKGKLEVFYGASVQHSVASDPTSKWNGSTRASFVKMYGPEDMDFSVYGVDFLASRAVTLSRWATLSPYAGVSGYLARADERTAAVSLANENVLGARASVGAELREALVLLMDRDRPWTDSELTLADLATRLETTPHKLSEVLNGLMGKTFYDFVNGYRVRDVQRRIEAGEARTRKMLALALDAGFASKSTFNQAFKKHTGQTPSDFSKVST